MPGHFKRARRRLVLIAGTTMIAAAGLGATAAPSMADFRVTTNTTLVASPTVVTSSGSTTLTASILPGFLVGPLGNVKFTDSTNGALLGTIKPKLAVPPAQGAVRRHAHRPRLGAGAGAQHDRRRLLGRPLHQAEQRVGRRVRRHPEHVPGRQRTVQHDRDEQRRLHQHDDQHDVAGSGNRDGSGVLRHSNDAAVREGGRRGHPRLLGHQPGRRDQDGHAHPHRCGGRCRSTSSTRTAWATCASNRRRRF